MVIWSRAYCACATIFPKKCPNQRLAKHHCFPAQRIEWQMICFCQEQFAILCELQLEYIMLSDAYTSTSGMLWLWPRQSKQLWMNLSVLYCHLVVPKNKLWFRPGKWHDALDRTTVCSGDYLQSPMPPNRSTHRSLRLKTFPIAFIQPKCIRRNSHS